jgi:hypothetical protein
VAERGSSPVYYVVSAHISPPAQDIIEISPAPDLYLVEFTFGRQPHNRISIVLPATCGLAAITRAWSLFPEYKRVTKRTSVHPIKYVEIDWQNGRTIIVKKKPQPQIPVFNVKESNAPRKRRKRNGERAE